MNKLNIQRTKQWYLEHKGIELNDQKAAEIWGNFYRLFKTVYKAGQEVRKRSFPADPAVPSDPQAR